MQQSLTAHGNIRRGEMWQRPVFSGGSLWIGCDHRCGERKARDHRCISALHEIKHMEGRGGKRRSLSRLIIVCVNGGCHAI